MYDVIISGAGPAGSKCAEILAKAGYKIALKISGGKKWVCKSMYLKSKWEKVISYEKDLLYIKL